MTQTTSSLPDPFLKLNSGKVPVVSSSNLIFVFPFPLNDVKLSAIFKEGFFFKFVSINLCILTTISINELVSGNIFQISPFFLLRTMNDEDVILLS